MVQEKQVPAFPTAGFCKENGIPSVAWRGEWGEGRMVLIVRPDGWGHRVINPPEVNVPQGTMSPETGTAATLSGDGRKVGNPPGEWAPRG
jgi:hypothetical protein